MQHPTTINQIPFLDYTIRYGWLYKLNHLCVTASEDRLTLIKEARASSYGGHFGSLKIFNQLQRYLFLLYMTRQVEHFIRSCALCSQHKTANCKFGCIIPFLYLPSLGTLFQWISLVVYL